MTKTPAEVLGEARVLAVVGASRHPEKAAHSVPSELQRHGYDVVPVNPSGAEILGRPAARSLAEVGRAVDMVVVFRPSDEAAGVARQAAAAGARSLWLQLGIRSDEARAIAEHAGMDFVEDACTAVVRSVYGVRPAPASAGGGEGRKPEQESTGRAG